MAHARLTPRFTPSARVQELSRDASHHRLTIPAGRADSYRLAQLDDYRDLPRRNFPHHSLTLSLLARTSSDSLPGTWGFGLWNDPFGLSLGFGGKPFRLPALPNAAWFFGASEENYLSFRDATIGGRVGRSPYRDHTVVSRPPGTGSASRSGLDASGKIARSTRPTGNGFMAQTFRSPKFHPLLIPAGLALPFSRKAARRLLGRVIAEDGMQLWDQNASKLVESKGVAPTDWHRYRLEWSPKRVAFEVDEARVFESSVSPNPPLGLVVWLDNQYAAFTPEGRLGFGVLENPEPAWLEIRELEIK